MKTTISNFYEFEREFRDFDRLDNFSRDGLRLLFEGLTEYEDSTGTEVEMDVIAFCCDFNENTFQEIADDYRIDVSDCEDEDEIRETVLDYLNDNTMVLGSNDEIVVYQCF